MADDAYIKRILDARIYDLVLETPIDPMHLLSHRLENEIKLKREDLQPVFSFKVRGAYNKLIQLNKNEVAAGVITASAGNHAQGLALAATHLKIKATIVMPRTTPKIKIDAVKRRGARVILEGDTYDQAQSKAISLAKEQGLTFIPAYDDADVIAGQGTVGMEILRQHPDPIHAIFIPVGGGGLCAGIATYVKYLRPDIKIIAVEPSDAASLDAALKAGRRVTLAHVGLFADGVAVAKIGKEPFRLLKDRVDQVITVGTDEICAAVKDIFEDTRSIAEPAGALALAGLKKYVETHEVHAQTLIAIDSGANTNFDRLRYISEVTEVGEQREAIFAVSIPEQAGSYLKFCRALGKRGITEFNYRFNGGSTAHIFVGVQVADREERLLTLKSLQSKGYDVIDMTDNELAKLHIRHMVGGHARVEDEILYRFEFPERPGALLEFLKKMAGRWNISIFHYRNHGAAFGRVLLGMQVPNSERKNLQEVLEELNYPHWLETHNSAYAYFLNIEHQ